MAISLLMELIKSSTLEEMLPYQDQAVEIDVTRVDNPSSRNKNHMTIDVSRQVYDLKTGFASTDYLTVLRVPSAGRGR